MGRLVALALSFAFSFTLSFLPQSTSATNKIVSKADKQLPSERVSNRVPELIYWYRNFDSPATYELLRLAIDNTTDIYGPLNIVRSNQLSQGRALAAVADHQRQLVGVINVVLDEYRREAQALIPIPIATDQGLVGYRVCIINKNDLKRFENIRSHMDMIERQVVFGQGAHWPDARILKSNNLSVVTSARYEQLFDMLKGRRFNCFLRGANEALSDLQAANDSSLVIEPSLAFVYPSVSLFFVNKNDAELAARIELGLRRAILSGKYTDFLNRYYEESLQALRVRHRRVIRLNNPLIDDLRRYQASGYLLSPEGKINY